MTSDDVVSAPVGWRRWARQQIQDEFGQEIERLVALYSAAPPQLIASFVLYKDGHGLHYFKQRQAV
jgi:hypothetical protein